MAYFLKKSHIKKGTYLQIYESYHDSESNQTRHRSYKAYGYLHVLQEQGIEDPIAFLEREVAMLNQERKLKEKSNEKKKEKITEKSKERNLGYFLWKCVNDGLGVEKYISLLQSDYQIQFNLYDVIANLVYARVISPCSKKKTYLDVLPMLYEKANMSLDQLYNALEIIGNEYERIIEIYNNQVNLLYPFSLKYTFFDCTNFYFEIDKEDEFRRKGPSKENRYTPLVGMGILLDANQIPLGMKLYPGNQSEKPIHREVLNQLKKKPNITGRSIRIADKGLNCAQNIYQTLLDGDGYLFSKSVKSLSAKEKESILLEEGYEKICDEVDGAQIKIKSFQGAFLYTFTDENGRRRTETFNEKRVVVYNSSLAKKKREEIYQEVEKIKNLTLSGAKRKEFGDRAKYVDFVSTNGKVFPRLNQDKIDEDLRLVGYNMIVTSEVKMDAITIYNAYKQLWRIEESFRIFKSDLDARPVYLQKENSIKGHFLICYLSVLILRLLQFKIFKHKYTSNAILEFAKKYRVVQSGKYSYLNISKKSDFATELANKTGLDILDFKLDDKKIDAMLKHIF